MGSTGNRSFTREEFKLADDYARWYMELKEPADRVRADAMCIKHWMEEGRLSKRRLRVSMQCGLP